MTGPEHYAAAERHLETAAGHCDRDETRQMEYELGRGIISALLALTAATALPGEQAGDWQREIWSFGAEPEPDPREYDFDPDAEEESPLAARDASTGTWSNQDVTRRGQS